MAIDFPNSPTANQTYTVGGKTWTYSVASYAIGATGPAGGKVFITPDTAGNTTGKYFEVAPFTWNGGGADPLVFWSLSAYATTAVTGANGEAIGTGYQNTLDIVAQGNTSSTAASMCSAYEANGFTDWFLPSKNELIELGNQQAIIGDLSTSIWYWSSTEVDPDGALNTAMYTPVSSMSNNVKYDAVFPAAIMARPVRSFTTEGGRWVVVDRTNNASNQIYDVTVLLRMETN